MAARLRLRGYLVVGLVSVLWIAHASIAEGAAQITKILQNQGREIQHSVHVVRLSDGKTLYQKNEDLLLSPASVSKVITTAAVLAKFSPAHTFTTKFYHTGSVKDGRIKGDLVIVGDGDPFLVSEKMWQLAADFRHMGIQAIDGNIVVDGSLFAGVGRDEARKSGKKGSRNAYDAPVSAFGINFNTVALAIAPGDSRGAKAKVSFDPYPLAHFDVTNNIKTIAAEKATRLSVQRVGSHKVIASGEVAQGESLRKIYRSVDQSLETSGEYVRAFLQGEGIAVKGKVVAGTLPASATLLYALDSYDLRRIVQGLNTFSNNYIADVLVKRLGAAFPQSGTPDRPGQGTYANGIGAIESFLSKDVGIKSKFVMENGSGLSTGNRLSAKQITDVLQYMERRMDVYPDFLASLPASGWDGTMAKRFRGDLAKYQGLVRAKTGTLTDPVSVAGLAGYFRHPSHGMVAFCLLENGVAGKKQPGIADLRRIQDDVVAALYSTL